MTAGLVALGDDHVDARVDVALGVLRLAGQRADEPALLLDALDHVRRRWTERVDDERAAVGERDLEVRRRALGRERRGLIATAAAEPMALVVVGQVGHVVATEDVVDERDVLGRDQRPDVVERELAGVGSGVLGRHDQVDSVGAVADLVLDPVEVDLELSLRVGHRAEHAHPAGLRHRGHDVAAVAEGEDRHIDAEHVGDRGLHVQQSHVARAGFLVRVSVHAIPCSTSGSRGSPSTCSATMLRCTANVPPPSVSAGENR